MKMLAMPPDLPPQLKAKWIDDPQTDAEAGWNAMIVLYQDLIETMGKLNPERLCQDDIIDVLEAIANDILFILGIEED
jgi:hypothetical protein